MPILTDTQIRLLISNVHKLSTDKLANALNILRPQKDSLPEIELKLLKTLEDELLKRK